MAKQILNQMETMFSALSDPTRLRLLNLMQDGEVCVCFFTEVLGESQPKVSRHLAYLRKAGLVKARRDGKWMHYSIEYPEDEGTREIIDASLKQLGNQEELRRERDELVKVCLSGTVPVTIKRAPKPEVVEAAEEKRSEPIKAEPEIETFLL